MRNLSLSFFMVEIENQFQQQNMKSNQKSFCKNLVFVAVIAFSISLYGYLHNNQWMALGFGYTISLPIVNFISKKGPLYFDLCVFLLQIQLNSGSPFILLLHWDIDPIADIQTYIIGYSLANTVHSFNLGSRFYLKVIAIFQNFFLLTIIKVFIQHDFTVLTLFFIGSNFLMINYVYQEDRKQRQAYLTKYNELLWQFKIGTCAKISIITSISKKGKLLLDSTNCNQISKKEFEISDQDSLKGFLKNFKMTQKINSTTRIINIMKQKQMSKFSCLHSFINNFLSKLKAVTLILLMFTTWNDNLLNIHTLIVRSSIEYETECRKIIKQERQLFTNFRVKFAFQIKTIFAKLQFMHQNHGQMLYNESIFSDVYDTLRMNYNLQFYLNPEYYLSRHQFFLKQLVEKINQIVKSGSPNLLKIDIQSNIDSGVTMFSCQKTVFQILFNFYTILVRSAQRSGTIQIIVQKRPKQCGSLLNFRIETDITSLELIMEGQNYQRNNCRKNSKLSLDVKKVGIEILVSEFLICKIGPIKYIKIVENYQKKIL